MAALPDLLTFLDGTPCTSPADWQRRRTEIKEWVTGTLFGEVPEGKGADLEPLGWEWFRVWPHGWEDASFLLHASLPEGEGPFPCVIYCDLCWDHLTPEVLAVFHRKGIGVLAFNREEIAPDLDGLGRKGLRIAMEERGLPVPGAIAAWAWGISRVVDVAGRLPRVDSGRLGCLGHSRGGKTSLLAGALDERISLVMDNQSGCMGSGSLLVLGEGAESLGDILRNFPFWFHPSLGDWVGREKEMGFDLHCLRALVAPRPFFFTGSEDDLWCGPSGVRATHEASLPAWEILSSPHRPEMAWRRGPHGHDPEDFALQADFAARVWGLQAG